MMPTHSDKLQKVSIGIFEGIEKAIDEGLEKVSKSKVPFGPMERGAVLNALMETKKKLHEGAKRVLTEVILPEE